jgi:hypothetical protein
MVIKRRKKELIKFFTLDGLTQKERSKRQLNIQEKNVAGKLIENEWVQEYELIYSLQDFEDWNLEEADNR